MGGASAAFIMFLYVYGYKLRKAAYIRADISDREQLLYDDDAIRTEKKRRELFEEK